MACDYIALANKGIQGLTPYQPGKPIDELERELGISNIIKLASNENPYGASPKVAEAIQGQIADVARYPDGNGFALKAALASHLGVTENTLSLGNGSNELLDLIARAYLDERSEAIFSQYAFAVYPISTQSTGARAVVTPALDYGHDLSAMLESITDKTRVIFIANPNNPTGTWLPKSDIEAFVSQVPERILVVIDEAYFEYVAQEEYGTALDLMEQYPNLVVSRTFSKAYGLASLRVGYCISHPDVADILNRVRNPFNVDSFALAAATAALEDQDFIRRSHALNLEGLQTLEQGVTDLGLEFIPSVGNFITVLFGRDAMPIYQALLREGVIVRPLANYSMPEALRVTVGTGTENTRFLAALSRVLA